MAATKRDRKQEQIKRLKFKLKQAQTIISGMTSTIEERDQKIIGLEAKLVKAGTQSKDDRGLMRKLSWALGRAYAQRGDFPDRNELNWAGLEELGDETSDLILEELGMGFAKEKFSDLGGL